MQKFLRIPVTNEQSQLLSVNGIVLVEQASTTTVTVAYQSGQFVTITHAAAGAGVETQRDAIQNAIIAALKQEWTKPDYTLGAVGNISLPFAVSAITATYDAVSFDTGSVISLTADTTLTANQSGAVVLLDAVGENITLPAASAGPWKFKFLATAAVSTTPWQIISAEGDNINGSVIVAGAAVPAVDEDQVNFIASAAVAGDFIEVLSDGTGLFVSGVGNASGSITATDPA